MLPVAIPPTYQSTILLLRRRPKLDDSTAQCESRKSRLHQAGSDDWSRTTFSDLFIKGADAGSQKAENSRRSTHHQRRYNTRPSTRFLDSYSICIFTVNITDVPIACLYISLNDRPIGLADIFETTLITTNGISTSLWYVPLADNTSDTYLAELVRGRLRFGMGVRRCTKGPHL
jgi:hypothetical protein